MLKVEKHSAIKVENGSLFYLTEMVVSFACVRVCVCVSACFVVNRTFTPKTTIIIQASSMLCRKDVYRIPIMIIIICIMAP